MNAHDVIMGNGSSRDSRDSPVMVIFRGRQELHAPSWHVFEFFYSNTQIETGWAWRNQTSCRCDSNSSDAAVPGWCYRPIHYVQLGQKLKVRWVCPTTVLNKSPQVMSKVLWPWRFLDRIKWDWYLGVCEHVLMLIFTVQTCSKSLGSQVNAEICRTAR